MAGTSCHRSNGRRPTATGGTVRFYFHTMMYSTLHQANLQDRDSMKVKMEDAYYYNVHAFHVKLAICGDGSHAARFCGVPV